MPDVCREKGIDSNYPSFLKAAPCGVSSPDHFTVFDVAAICKEIVKEKPAEREAGGLDLLAVEADYAGVDQRVTSS